MTCVTKIFEADTLDVVVTVRKSLAPDAPLAPITGALCEAWGFSGDLAFAGTATITNPALSQVTVHFPARSFVAPAGSWQLVLTLGAEVRTVWAEDFRVAKSYGTATPSLPISATGVFGMPVSTAAVAQSAIAASVQAIIPASLVAAARSVVNAALAATIAVGMSATAAVAGGTVTTPYTVAIISDSFGMRSTDVSGSPNSVDAGSVNPVSKKWPIDATNQLGGMQWGFASHIDMLSGGKFVCPWQTNRAVGGLNTGQLAQDSVAGDWLFDAAAYIATLAGTLIYPDAVIYQAGTNDDATNAPATSSYNNIRAALKKFTDLGIPVFLSTVLPRGNAAFPTTRVADIATLSDLNNRLIGIGYPGMAAEATLNGLVRVIDPRASFRDLSGQSNDVLATHTYDGLHLNAVGARIFARAYLAEMNAYFTTTISSLLPTGTTMGVNGLMTGTGGVLTYINNAANNIGFTINGSATKPVNGGVPTGWTVTTTLNGGAVSWAAVDPKNTKGTLVVDVVAAAVGSGLRIILNANGAGNLDDNTRALEAFHPVTLDGSIAVGEWFKGIAVVELSSHVGLRGLSCEMRLTEPDAVLRTRRTSGPAPNGTLNMLYDPTVDFVGANRFVLQTPPIKRLAGTYNLIELAVVLMIAGLVNPVTATMVISQAGVIKLT